MAQTNDTQIDQWNKIESLEINSYIDGQLWPEQQDNSMGKNNLQEMLLRQMDSHIQKNEFRLLSYYKYKN